MSDSKKGGSGDALLALVLFAGMATAFVGIGFGGGQVWEREKAVEAKAGQWVVNAETGATEFRYGGTERKGGVK